MGGEIWRFSNQIDDLDIMMLQKDFITYQEGQRYYNIGEKAFIRLTHEAGAVYKIGDAVRINRKILEAYMRSLPSIPQKGMKFSWDSQSTGKNQSEE